MIASIQGALLSMAPSITCPRCGKTSYHPDDIDEGYCGACHWWTSDPLLAPYHSDDEGSRIEGVERERDALRADNDRLREAIDAALIRCREGDPHSDWLPTIDSILSHAVEAGRRDSGDMI